MDTEQCNQSKISIARQHLRTAYNSITKSISNGIRSPKYRLIFAFTGASVFWILCFLLWITSGPVGLFIVGALIVFMATVCFLLIIFKLGMLERYRVQDERAFQALAGIYTALKPERPLPYFRSAALSSDSCLEYIRLIEQLSPNLILELGSGSSTIIAGHQIKKNGSGRVIAVDHEERWGLLTRHALKEHKLEDVAEVRIAPLKSVMVSGRSYEWYDISQFDGINTIDLLLIDGPPDNYDAGNRYPGLEYLKERMSEQAVILVDDCDRPHWENNTRIWAERNGFIVTAMFLNEKNTLVLQRK